ncbi:F-box/FBD/LRR-repeat protein At1g13570 [Cajanus cajan]|uniref:F-box/FBD/LRR-repeat protein At1g13570 n=1 Tax=Cajanus cajan TaxID=3821 RepID=UPI00098DBF76|nr:F-box/FBD/LRR-repeat protein At1g13570 [Cajanus cajan]
MLSTVPDFGAFKSLGTLYLSDVRFEPNVFESLMLGCPSLVTLDISHCSGLKSINVSSPVLEILNLQGDQATESICLENAKNLTDLALLADRPGDNFERDTISNLIKGLSKIKSICLGEGYFKIFSIGFPKRLQGSLNCLKHVELYGVDFTETRELLFVISLLKSSPNIEKLLIESHSNNLDLGLQHTLDESIYDRCCFTQLLTVNIIVKNACNSTLKFIKFLLANSSSLEILSFNVDLGKDHYLVPHISRDLQQMERASQRAEVEFIYDDMID